MLKASAQSFKLHSPYAPIYLGEVNWLFNVTINDI